MRLLTKELHGFDLFFLLLFSFASMPHEQRYDQCDQMASLLVQYLAVCNTEHLSKTISNLPK